MNCIICALPIKDGCKHSEEERKKAEIDAAYEEHNEEWEDRSGERIRKENEEYDLKRGAYHGVYKPDD